MRKFSKALVLLLALIALVTAVTVVALADDETPGDTTVTSETDLSSQYDGQFTNQDGEVTYFKGYKEFEAIVQSVIDNAASANKSKMNTIVLFNDLEYYQSFSFTKKQYVKLTIDLNGHTLTRVNLYGDVYVNGEKTEETRSSVAAAFVISYKTANSLYCRYADFKIYSSSERGTFRTVSDPSLVTVMVFPLGISNILFSKVFLSYSVFERSAKGSMVAEGSSATVG